MTTPTFVTSRHYRFWLDTNYDCLSDDEKQVCVDICVRTRPFLPANRKNFLPYGYFTAKCLDMIECQKPRLPVKLSADRIALFDAMFQDMLAQSQRTDTE